jgi:uncharacterized membrane protein YagU involved in acid resistance
MKQISGTWAIVIGGAIAGTCDILYAIIYSWLARGTSPVRILQSVASGVLGKAAFDGRWLTAELGLFLHFFIAFSCAIIFYLAARRIPILATQAVWSGLIYGFLIFWFMRLVVVPLSAAPFTLSNNPLELFFHMFTVGLPIALLVKRSLASKI